MISGGCGARQRGAHVYNTQGRSPKRSSTFGFTPRPSKSVALPRSPLTAAVSSSPAPQSGSDSLLVRRTATPISPAVVTVVGLHSPTHIPRSVNFSGQLRRVHPASGGPVCNCKLSLFSCRSDCRTEARVEGCRYADEGTRYCRRY